MKGANRFGVLSRVKMKSFTRLMNDEAGQDLTEYALVGAFMGLVAITSMKSVGTSLANLFTGVVTSVNASV